MYKMMETIKLYFDKSSGNKLIQEWFVGIFQNIIINKRNQVRKFISLDEFMNIRNDCFGCRL